MHMATPRALPAEGSLKGCRRRGLRSPSVAAGMHSQAVAHGHGDIGLPSHSQQASAGQPQTAAAFAP
jgi:hypothetical protein